MIPDFPHNMKIRLTQSKKFLLRPDIEKSLPCAKLRQPTGQNQDATFFSMWPILFFYCDQSLVSSNLNSKLFRFHSAHPNLHTLCTSLCKSGS